MLKSYSLSRIIDSCNKNKFILVDTTTRSYFHHTQDYISVNSLIYVKQNILDVIFDVYNCHEHTYNRKYIYKLLYSLERSLLNDCDLRQSFKQIRYYYMYLYYII